MHRISGLSKTRYPVGYPVFFIHRKVFLEKNIFSQFNIYFSQYRLTTTGINNCFFAFAFYRKK